jgi:hypothetical protein
MSTHFFLVTPTLATHSYLLLFNIDINDLSFPPLSVRGNPASENLGLLLTCAEGQELDITITCCYLRALVHVKLVFVGGWMAMVGLFLHQNAAGMFLHKNAAVTRDTQQSVHTQTFCVS